MANDPEAQKLRSMFAQEAIQAIVKEKQQIASVILNRTGWQVSIADLAAATSKLYGWAHPGTRCGGCSGATVQSVRDAQLPRGVTYTEGPRKRLINSVGTEFRFHKIAREALRDAAAALEIEVPDARPERPSKPRRAAVPPIVVDPTVPLDLDSAVASLAVCLRVEGYSEIIVKLKPEGYSYRANGGSKNGTGGATK